MHCKVTRDSSTRFELKVLTNANGISTGYDYDTIILQFLQRVFEHFTRHQLKKKKIKRNAN